MRIAQKDEFDVSHLTNCGVTRPRFSRLPKNDERIGHCRCLLSARLVPMLDIQFIREHTDIVKESQRKRGESVELVDEVLPPTTHVVRR